MSIITYDKTTSWVNNVPPEISAAKIYPAVATIYDLPSSGNKTGDVYDVLDIGMNYAWNGTSWDAFNAITDMYIGSITKTSGSFSVNKTNEESEKEKTVKSEECNNKNNKGETTMPTAIVTNDITYYALRDSRCETPVFNADRSIKKVIFSGPATIVIWSDGTKTVVKCMEGDDYDPEKGLMMCIMQKLLGGKSAVKKLFKKHIPEEDMSSTIESVVRAMEELKDSFARFAPNNLPIDHKEENEK